MLSFYNGDKEKISFENIINPSLYLTKLTLEVGFPDTNLFQIEGENHYSNINEGNDKYCYLVNGN